MESFEIIIVILHSCFAILGISINLLLLVVIFRHTPTSFSNFGILLKVHVLADLTNSLGCVAEMPRMIVIKQSILFISYGPCGYVSTTACYCASVAMFGGEVCPFYIILASFVFRLLVIEGKNPSKRATYGIVCGIALPIPTAMMIAIVLARTSDEDAQKLMNAFDTEYGAYTHVVTGDKHFKTSYDVMILCGSKRCPQSRDNSRIFHHDSYCTALLRNYRSSMLSTQALLPILPSFSVSTYLIEFFDIYRHPALESSTALVGETTFIFSPIVTILFIDHYRNILMSPIRKRLGTKSQNVTTKTSNMTSTHVL